MVVAPFFVLALLASAGAPEPGPEPVRCHIVVAGGSAASLAEFRGAGWDTAAPGLGSGVQGGLRGAAQLRLRAPSRGLGAQPTGRCLRPPTTMSWI